jgi:carbon monoxide dehydrogenase subunit G
MDLTHSFTVPAGIDETYAAFNSIELLASCFPGATVSSVDDNEFAGSLKLKLGPIMLAYAGTGRFIERNPSARRTVVQTNGVDRRGQGTAAATVRTTMTANGDGTAVELAAKVQFTGKPDQFGRGVVEDVADRLLDQFAHSVAARFADGVPPELLTASGELPATGKLRHVSAFSWSPPRTDSQTDFEVFSAVAPGLAKRFGPPVLGGVALLWVVNKLTKPRKRAKRRALTGSTTASGAGEDQ